MVVPLLLVFMPVSTGLALFLPRLALAVVATLSLSVQRASPCKTETALVQA